MVVRFFFNLNNSPSNDAANFSCPIIPHRRLAQIGQAASAINIADECGSLTSDDEIHSEPLGRKIREQPNYYFEYKKKLKELMGDDSTSSCTPGSACSLSTLIAEHHGMASNNGDEDDDQVRFDDGYQSSDAATPGPMIDLDDVHEENVTQIYSHSLSTNTVDGELRQSNERRLDSIYLTNRNGDDRRSDGSSSSSGLGTIQANSPQQRSIEKSISVICDDVPPMRMISDIRASATMSDDVVESKKRFQLARQQVMQKLDFMFQNTNNVRPTTTNVNDKNLNVSTLKPKPISCVVDADTSLSIEKTVRDDDARSPIYDLPIRLMQNRIYQTIDDADDDDDDEEDETILKSTQWRSTPTTPAYSPITVRSDRESRCISWELDENHIKNFSNNTHRRQPSPAPPKSIASYGLGTLGRKTLIVANIDIENKKELPVRVDNV